MKLENVVKNFCKDNGIVDFCEANQINIEIPLDDPKSVAFLIRSSCSGIRFRREDVEAYPDGIVEILKEKLLKIDKI